MDKISKYLKNIPSGEYIIYRGHANREWELKPSIGRHYTGKWSKALKYEIKALEEFKKLSTPYIKTAPKKDIEWLCLMQHHGCATRLLDFTNNPLIALFFATDPSSATDGEVISAKYERNYNNLNNDDIFEKTNSFAYYPPHITQRIVGQAGCFVCSNEPNSCLSGVQIRRIKISNEDKSIIRLQLNKLGINYASLFPSIDGICQDLNDTLIWDLQLEDIFS